MASFTNIWLSVNHNEKNSYVCVVNGIEREKNSCDSDCVACRTIEAEKRKNYDVSIEKEKELNWTHKNGSYLFVKIRIIILFNNFQWISMQNNIYRMSEQISTFSIEQMHSKEKQQPNLTFLISFLALHAAISLQLVLFRWPGFSLNSFRQEAELHDQKKNSRIWVIIFCSWNIDTMAMHSIYWYGYMYLHGRNVYRSFQFRYVKCFCPFFPHFTAHFFLQYFQSNCIWRGQHFNRKLFFLYFLN